MKFSQKLNKPTDIKISPILLWGKVENGRVLEGDG